MKHLTFILVALFGFRSFADVTKLPSSTKVGDRFHLGVMNTDWSVIEGIDPEWQTEILREQGYNGRSPAFTVSRDADKEVAKNEALRKCYAKLESKEIRDLQSTFHVVLKEKLVSSAVGTCSLVGSADSIMRFPDAKDRTYLVTIKKFSLAAKGCFTQCQSKELEDGTKQFRCISGVVAEVIEDMGAYQESRKEGACRGA